MWGRVQKFFLALKPSFQLKRKFTNAQSSNHNGEKQGRESHLNTSCLVGAVAPCGASATDFQVSRFAGICSIGSKRNPNDHCFDWKRPCFGGLTFKNRGHLGSRYTYIRIRSIHIQHVYANASARTHTCAYAVHTHSHKLR